MRTLEEAASAAAQIGFPVVVKPVIGTGSAGVLLIRDADDLPRAHERALRVARELNGAQSVLVEEYLDGMEVCVDSLVHHGEIIFENITDHPPRLPGKTFEGIEYVTPTSLSPELAQQVYQLNRRTVAGLGLTDGVSHTEIKVTRAGPRLIEAHPRIAGHRMPEIVHRAVGVDLFGAAIDIALGIKPSAVPERRGYSAYRCLCPPRSGLLQSLDGVDQASQLPGILEIAVQIPPGSPVTALPDAVQQNIAFILAHGSSYQAVRDRARAAEQAIRIMISG